VHTSPAPDSNSNLAHWKNFKTDDGLFSRLEELLAYLEDASSNRTTSLFLCMLHYAKWVLEADKVEY
jgi:hypothetical protein